MQITWEKSNRIESVLELKYVMVLNSLYNVVESFTAGFQIPLCL